MAEMAANLRSGPWLRTTTTLRFPLRAGHRPAADRAGLRAVTACGARRATEVDDLEVERVPPVFGEQRLEVALDLDDVARAG